MSATTCPGCHRVIRVRALRCRFCDVLRITDERAWRAQLAMQLSGRHLRRAADEPKSDVVVIN